MPALCCRASKRLGCDAPVVPAVIDPFFNMGDPAMEGTTMEGGAMEGGAMTDHILPGLGIILRVISSSGSNMMLIMRNSSDGGRVGGLLIFCGARGAFMER